MAEKTYTVVTIEDEQSCTHHINANSVTEAKQKAVRLRDCPECGEYKPYDVELVSVFEGKHKDLYGVDDGVFEHGHASLTLNLSGGVIVARHGGGQTLLRGHLLEGGWDAIITALLEHCPDGFGPMRDERT